MSYPSRLWLGAGGLASQYTQNCGYQGHKARGVLAGIFTASALCVSVATDSPTLSFVAGGPVGLVANSVAKNYNSSTPISSTASSVKDNAIVAGQDSLAAVQSFGQKSEQVFRKVYNWF